jgi:hypothetical protein
MWMLGRQVEPDNPELALALRDGSATLRNMARCATDAQILLERSQQAQESGLLRWVDRKAEILSAAQRGGGAGVGEKLTEALERAEAVARVVHASSPTGEAFRHICDEAGGGARILFVVDDPQDAVFAQAQLEEHLTAHAGTVVPEVSVRSYRHFREAMDDFHPNRLVLAIRGPVMARELLNWETPLTKIDLVLVPSENDRLAWTLQHMQHWSEYGAWHLRAKGIQSRLPPTLTNLSSFSIDVERRATHTPRRYAAVLSDVTGSFDIDDGDRIYFHPGSMVTVLEERSPAIKPATQLKPGDRVFVMPEDLRSEIAAEFEAYDRKVGMTPSARAVRTYKEAVSQAKTRLGSALTPERVLRDMRQIAPDLPLPTEATIRTWLSADEHADEDRPFAAGGELDLARKRFVAFAQVLGLAKGLAAFLFEDIHDRRGELRLGGLIRRSQFERLLFDPMDVVRYYGLPESRVRALREQALAEFHEVIGVQKPTETPREMNRRDRRALTLEDLGL